VGDLKARQFSNDTLRIVARSVTRRFGKTPPPRLSTKAIRGLAEFAELHGAAATRRLLKRVTDDKALFRLLSNIDTAARVATDLNQPRALNQITRRLKFNYGSFIGAYHELDAIARYRRRMLELGTLFDSREGVDYVLRKGGFEQWLECKGFVTRNPVRIWRNAAKVARQFKRFAREWKRQNGGDLDIRYVFRGSFRDGRVYFEAIQKVIPDLIKDGTLSKGFKFPRSRVEFLGLGRVV
jgi:hypothetical protein